MRKAPEGSQDPGPDEQAPSGSGLERVSCHEDLVKALAEQFARADVSLRELQARADRAGGVRLPRATCADMLAGRRFPKKALMVAFLRACRVPEPQIPAWERTWERVRLTRMPLGQDRTTASSTGAPPEDQRRTAGGTPPEDRGRRRTVGGARPAGRGRRRAIVLAGAITVAVGVGLVLTAALRGGMSEGLPGDIVDVGHIVSDDGRAFGGGGSSRFTVTVSPANTGVRLIRRLDVGVPLQHATITVNGAPAGAWRPLLGDELYKWRNQIVELPPHLTAGRGSLTIVNASVGSSDFNEFRYIVKHKVDDVWSIIDTIDIGPDHTADEAMHGYRIVGQGWLGTQTFAYPPRTEDWNIE